MVEHQRLTPKELYSQLKNNRFSFAGNLQLKIYGTLHCASGKRMKKENRVFFKNEKEAVKSGFRPCGHCMRFAYQNWKVSKKQVE